MSSFFDTVPAYKLPDKSTSLAERAYWAQVNMPQNAAHANQLGLAVDKSVKYQLRSDEMIHGFARSRTSADNPIQTWHAELMVQPQHHQAGPYGQQPDDNARYVTNQRVAQYSSLSPVAGGYVRSRMMM